MAKTVPNIDHKVGANIMVCWTGGLEMQDTMYGTGIFRIDTAEDEMQGGQMLGLKIPSRGPVRDWKPRSGEVDGRGRGSVNGGRVAGMENVRLSGREQWCGSFRFQPGLEESLQKSKQRQ